jgi:hypothetical protein
MAKERKTRGELILLIEQGLIQHHRYQYLGKIRVHPHDDEKTGITWGIDLLNPDNPIKIKWAEELNAIVPLLQLTYDLAEEASDTIERPNNIRDFPAQAPAEINEATQSAPATPPTNAHSRVDTR